MSLLFTSLFVSFNLGMQNTNEAIKHSMGEVGGGEEEERQIVSDRSTVLQAGFKNSVSKQSLCLS